ncbi:MAG: sulfotransferase [Candidatus Binatia bacterium]|nr:sulfotransferase [Candidatus Binatia bacterium]
MRWQPPPRAPWVDQLNALGENLDGGGRSLVSLDAAGLLRDAAAGTGLDDFGDDWFREPLGVLLRSFEEEAKLTLVGRLIARADVQRLLSNRLRIEDHVKRHPEIGDQKIEAPIVVTGLGRAGTTFLHELLAQDPDNRVPMLWEMMYSVPPPETATYETDPRILASHREISLMDEVVPAFQSMQEVAGDLPNECIFLVAHQLSTDKFIGEFDIPSYMGWTSFNDQRPAYEYHQKILRLLQSRHRGTRWALKAPSHLHLLPTLFATYPDARVVIPHRDPLRVLGSLSNLMASLRWMRSNEVDYDGIVAAMNFGAQYQMDNLSQQRDDGTVPTDQILDIRYVDLVADPIATMKRIYAYFEITFSTAFETRLQARLGSRPRGDRAAHEYTFDDTGLDLAKERAKHAGYQERYDVPSEL